MTSETSSSESSPDWANLLPEILVSIAKRLAGAALDYFNFSAVCTSWASIATPEHGMPPPLPLRKQYPFLLMRGDDGEQRESITLLDIFDNPRRSYKIGQLPEIGGKCFAGSQFGWIALVDEFSTPSLLNPFTRAHVELPPISTLNDITPVFDSNGSLSGYSYTDQFYSLEEFRSAVPLRKLVLSSNPSDGNFTAAAIFGYYCVLIFCRPGEKTWNYWWNWNKRHLRDPVCEVMYREGKFLALTEPGDVYEIDPFHLSAEYNVFYKVDNTYSALRYMLYSSGDLMHVLRESEHRDARFKTKKFEVRRLDPETNECVIVPSLGDRALFVGTSCGMSIPAGNGVKGNCVYFTDNEWDLFIDDEGKEMDRDMGVFDMINVSSEILYPPKPQLKWPPPIWIMSPLL